MSAPALDPLREAVTALAGVWADAGSAADLDRLDLVSLTRAIGSARRALDALQADVAAAIAHESRPELGAESLAKQQGFRNTAQLIATTTGTSAGDAARLAKVGEAIAPRQNLLGEPAPAKYPRDAPPSLAQTTRSDHTLRPRPSASPTSARECP